MRRHSRSEQDQQDAEQFARLMCVHPDAVDDFITYARREARALLNEHAPVVRAVTEALLEAETLTGEQSIASSPKCSCVRIRLQNGSGAPPS